MLKEKVIYGHTNTQIQVKLSDGTYSVFFLVSETARIIIYVLIFLVKPQNKIILYLLLSNLIVFKFKIYKIYLST